MSVAEMHEALASTEVLVTGRRNGPKPSAREWFAYLRQLSQDSRPIIQEAEYRDVELDFDGETKRVKVMTTPPVYGKPTFHNSFIRNDITGKLVHS